MHRFSWDMHYDPLPGAARRRTRRRWRANGAVPHRTYPSVNSPWVAPGAYTVRLTANGQTLTQPITIKMDPRVKITPEVQQIFTLTTQMEDNARNAAAAYKEARDLADKVKARPQSAANDALLKQLEEIAPVEAPGAGGGGRGGRGGGGGFGAPGAGRSAEPRQSRRPNGRRRDGHAGLRDAAHRGATPGVQPADSRLHGADGQVGRTQSDEIRFLRNKPNPSRDREGAFAFSRRPLVYN